MNLVSCGNLFYFNYDLFFSIDVNVKSVGSVVQKIKDNKIPVVLKLENSKSDVALTIAKGAKYPVKTFYSCHNCSKRDFEKGVSFLTYVSKNLETLKEAVGV